MSICSGVPLERARLHVHISRELVTFYNGMSKPKTPLKLSQIYKNLVTQVFPQVSCIILKTRKRLTNSTRFRGKETVYSLEVSVNKRYCMRRLSHIHVWEDTPVVYIVDP